MDDRTKSSLTWGLLGGLAFLVLVQTTRLIAELGIGLFELLPVTFGVFAVTAGLGYFLEGRLAQKRQV